MSNIKDFICVNHPDRPLVIECPVCLQNMCDEKDGRIAELCAELRQIRETTSADPRIADFLMEASNSMKRIAEARRLLERIKDNQTERADIGDTAEKWLEGKP